MYNRLTALRKINASKAVQMQKNNDPSRPHLCGLRKTVEAHAVSDKIGSSSSGWYSLTIPGKDTATISFAQPVQHL